MLANAARPALRRASVALVSRPVAAAPSLAPVAGYATLREIESRLKSIRNIEKITNTMKVVASTKLNRAMRAMTESKTFGQTSNKVYEEAETKVPQEAKTLIVVASSDKGLCGGIHSALTKATRKKLLENPSADLVVLGEKCKAQLQREKGQSIVLSFANVGKDIPTFTEAQAIADQIFQLPKEYDNIEVLFNTYLSPVSYDQKTIQTYSVDSFQESANFSAFEIDDEELPNLREFALANAIYWALAEGHACEQSARRNAMDNASKNAGEMINKFQILFNRTRQAVITGELVEIITGAAASEDS
ncbi:Inceptin [Dactylella cylindrospora]|nr:Inceptin [Dactylella cylindrospora]